MRVRLKVNSEEWLEAFEKYPARIRAAIARGLNRAGEIVARAASINLTLPKLGGYSSVFTGTLLRAMAQGWSVDPKLLTLRVGPSLAKLSREVSSYALFVEEGRKPGRRPPARALELWVKRKLGVAGDRESRRVAFIIAKKIGAEGTEPAPFLGPAIDSNLGRMRDAIQAEVDAEVALINAEG